MKIKHVLLMLFLSSGFTSVTLGALTISSALAADFTVTKTADSDDGTCDSDCSLREAIAAANTSTEDNTIVLPAGVYMLTLLGANEDTNLTGDLDISSLHALTITGAGAGQTLINANGIDRVFHILTGTVVISGVTIYNGSVRGSGLTDGGGIYGADANFTLINTVVYSNAASNNGAGIYVAVGNARLAESQIYSNTVVNFGGGIYVASGTAVLTDTKVYSNAAGNAGGGLYVSTGRAVLTKTQIYSNSAVNNGGGILVNFGNASLAEAKVYSNTANFGGGLYVAFGDAALTNAEIYQNSSENSGGGVYVSTGNASLTGTQIYRNQSLSGGGMFVAAGSAALVESEIARNDANANGGGVLVSTGNLSLTATNVLRNSAGNSGGGLFLVSSGTITATNGCIVFNSHVAVARTNVANGTLLATDNWWGTGDGPGGEGPGSGDTVGPEVNYLPFKTAPPASCPSFARIYLPLLQR